MFTEGSQVESYHFEFYLLQTALKLAESASKFKAQTASECIIIHS